MNCPIDPGAKVAELIAAFPELRPVLARFGFEALLSDEGMWVLAPFLSLETALRSRGVTVIEFVTAWQQSVAARPRFEAPALSDYASQGQLTLLALMPCGIKVPFAEAISAFVDDWEKQGGPPVRYAVEGNLNQELSYYAYVGNLQRLEELPDIVVSADFNSFYHRRFQQQFVEPGHFVDVARLNPSAAYVQAGILDPAGHSSVLGVNPLVMVADLERLGDRPLPTGWPDLLNPCWEDEVTLRGNRDFFCHAVLLPFYREQGAEGLRRLARNVREGLHPAQMVKAIDSGRGGALYVMPEFFAHRVKNQQRVRIIWPSDGALASPVTLMVKRQRVEQLAPLLDYLTGRELARILAGARFPVPHADIPGDLQDQPLKWIGWDFIRNNDLAAVNSAIDAVFMPAVQKALG